EMLGWLDDGRVGKLTLLCSSFFRDHNRGLWQETLDQFRERKQRCAAARTHAKVITLDLASGARLSLEGAADLRSNSNREQFALIHADAMHEWHAAWIDELVEQYEGEDDDEEGE